MATTWIKEVCRTTVVIYLFVLLAEALKGYEGVLKSNPAGGCSAVKYAYESKGYTRDDVPSSMISGEHLAVCAQGHTCCSKEMESNLEKESKNQFDKAMADKIGLLRNTFISRTAKFDTFFTELLDNAKQDLHNMFVRTYGLLYRQNSYIFTDLFEELRAYYKGRDINLLDVLDNFFTTLLEKMFILLHSSYQFDDTYLECITDHMAELKPFGDVPQKLSQQVKRSFIAARTFVQGLAVGRDVVLAVSKLEVSSSCKSALVKMSYCQYCKGVPYVNPCNNYCMNVMKGCLAYYMELSNEWNTYIDNLMKLAERLEGPFNIEAVVDPIDVKISDAIMNFQEASETITSKVFQGCGRPEPADSARGKREAAAASSYGEYHWDVGKDYVRPTTAAGTSLDRLVRDIKEKVETARDFYKNLPNNLCKDIAAEIFKEDQCWNGMGVNSYMPEVMRDGVENQVNNPEVDVDIRKSNTVVNQQILQLKLISNKLRNAYNGVDVDWVDTADVMDEYSSGSGSGSGSGSHGDGYKGGYRDDGGDGISFSHPTWQPPPRIETHRPPYRSDPEDTYGENDLYDLEGSCGLTRPSHLLLVVLFIACTLLRLRHTDS